MDTNDTQSELGNIENELVCKLKDEDSLYKAYMPYIKDGGIFVPTKKDSYKLGDIVNLQLEILTDTTPTFVSGIVVWIAPQVPHSDFTAGIGVRMQGDEAKDIRKRIESAINNKLKMNDPTNTL